MSAKCDFYYVDKNGDGIARIEFLERKFVLVVAKNVVKNYNECKFVVGDEVVSLTINPDGNLEFDSYDPLLEKITFAGDSGSIELTLLDLSDIDSMFE